jgi:hypothetical protein
MCGESKRPFDPSRRSASSDLLHGLMWLARRCRWSLIPVSRQACSRCATSLLKKPCPRRASVRARISVVRCRISPGFVESPSKILVVEFSVNIGGIRNDQLPTVTVSQDGVATLSGMGPVNLSVSPLSETTLSAGNFTLTTFTLSQNVSGARITGSINVGTEHISPPPPATPWYESAINYALAPFVAFADVLLQIGRAMAPEVEGCTIAPASCGLG